MNGNNYFFIKTGLLAFLIIIIGTPMIKAQDGRIKLPSPDIQDSLTVSQAIEKRRTIRSFTDEKVTLAQISQLLWAAQGITSPQGLRAAPSAGALYPLELYINVKKSDSLREGIYKFNPISQSLFRVIDKDLSKEIAEASLHQKWMAEAPVMFVFTAIYERTTGKYGDRGVRYAMIEAGSSSENLFLQAQSIGLDCGIVGAFHDSEIKQLLDLEKRSNPLLIMPVGYSNE
jgi:SagB-type dehydrogenase family enzyme